MEPSPTPTLIPEDTPGLAEFGLEIMLAVGLMFTAGAVMALVLLRLARHAPATLVTVSLAILTLTAILLYGATQSEALLGLAGTGLGALATALANLFKNTQTTANSLWDTDRLRQRDKEDTGEEEP
jgi:Na+/glutamate symporter